MTNEELVEKIQQGERDLLPQLWEQVERFVKKLACERVEFRADGAALVRGVIGLELDDLIQTGYVALLEAVYRFDATQGVSFLTFFSIYLKNHFNLEKYAASGQSRYINQRARELKRAEDVGKKLSPQDQAMIDRLYNTSSINAPLKTGDDAGDEIGAFIADPNDLIGDAEERIFQQQLHEALEEAMDTLEPDERQAIKLQYYQELDRKGVAEELSVSYERAKAIEAAAMRKLRSPSITAELESYIDRRTPYFLHVGVEAFHSSGTSAVERIVLLREQMRERKGGA